MLNGEWSPRFSRTARLAAAIADIIISCYDLLMYAVAVVNANLLVELNAVCLSIASIGLYVKQFS